MKQIIKEIHAALSAIPELRYIADDWGQMDGTNPPVQYPCAITNIDAVTFSEKSNRNYHCEATLSISIYDLLLQNISASAPDALQDQYYRIFELCEGVIDLLTALQSTLHSRLVCRSLRHIVREDDLRQYTLQLSLSYALMD